MSTDPGDLVLDPTCGSGTSATVAEQWGRRWITIDTSRVALALARARIMGARYPWYLLADSPEGQRKEAEITRRAPSEAPTGGDIHQGFVYERVPHITLKSIANNAEIDVIWEQWQETLEPLRTRLNAALGEAWEEWEIPREAGEGWPADAATTHADWWEARIARQKEIDASIAAKADHEYLYDKPYTDNARIRVAGPFTVESLAPHRMLAVDENDELFSALADKKLGYGEAPEFRRDDPGEFCGRRVSSRRTGRTASNSPSLTPWPGHYVCAEGRYVEGGGETGATRRAGVFIGPEFGTVARPDLVAAAREAADAGFDVLIACAFSYDAHAAEFEKLGRIPVLKARMNADLHMAGDLKNTGKGNLFVIFGEPDIDILEDGEDTIRVRINGVDVFHPNTGEVRSDGADGIACWFVDTDYNEESFFVPPRLLPRRERPLQGAQDDAESRDRPRRLGHPQPRHLPPLPAPRLRPHRRQGHQPPRRRGNEGVQPESLDRKDLTCSISILSIFPFQSCSMADCSLFLNINVPIAGRLINETTYSKISSACILRGGASATSWLQSFVGEKKKLSIGTDEFYQLDVVDGQQRLTTLIILLNAIRFALNTENAEEKKLQRELSELLVKGDGAKLLLLQTNHDSSHYFSNYLRNGTADHSRTAHTLADRELLQAVEDCQDFVESWQERNRRLTSLAALLKNRLSFLLHEITDEKAVYTVFEVLNSRGLDVSWFDRLKSMLMGAAFELKHSDRRGLIEELHSVWRDIYSIVGLSQGLSTEALRSAATLWVEDAPSRPLGEQDSVEALRNDTPTAKEILDVGELVTGCDEGL